MASPTENQGASAWRTPGCIAAGLLVLAVICAHLPRASLSLPLYSGDEGSYLIRALMGGLLKADPSRAATVPDVDNSVFFWIIRAVHLVAGKAYLDVLRLLAGCAYVGGLVLAWRGVRSDLAPREALGLLLLALIYPYYRFVLTALPEGWYVGLLGLIIFLTARYWRSRPLAHAAASGALVAALVLIKPHGVAVGAALIALVVADFVFDARRRLADTAARLALGAASFLATGHLIQLIEGRGLPTSLLFFGHGFYGNILAVTPNPDAPHIGLVALFTMGVAVMVLAGVPLILAADRLYARWVAGPAAFRLEARDMAFLLTAGAMLATVAMVTIFAMKISGMGPSETFRLWGRYFEFFVPLIWITAWPYVREAEGLPERRLLAAGVVLAGLIGLTYALKQAITLFPWDSSGLEAFSMSNPRWPGSRFPSYVFAAGAVVGAIVLMLKGKPLLPVWQGVFAILAALAIGQDTAWLGEVLPDRAALVGETGGVRQMSPRLPGRMAAFVDDNNIYNNIFLRLDGRPQMILIAPDSPVSAEQAAPFSVILVQTRHTLTAPGWRLIQPGGKFQVYQRGSLDTPIK